MAGLNPIAIARNRLRPHFRPRKAQPFWRELQTVRQEASQLGLTEICELVEGNSNYAFPGLGATFPTDPHRIPDVRFRRLRPLPGVREWELQAARINHHSKRLGEALSSLSAINIALCSNRLDDADRLIKDHIREHGNSLVILKKMLLLSVLKGGLSGLLRTSKLLLRGAENTGWSIFVRLNYDIVDPTSDPIKAARAWVTQALSRADRNSWYTIPIISEITSFASPKYGAPEACLRYSCSSLLDLTLSIWKLNSHAAIKEQYIPVYRQLNKDLQSQLVQQFSDIQIPIFSKYLTATDRVSDKESWRSAFVFSEYKSTSEWNAAFASIALWQNQERPALTGNTVAAAFGACATRISLHPELAQTEMEALQKSHVLNIKSGDLNIEHRALQSALYANTIEIYANGEYPAVGSSLAEILASIEEPSRALSSAALASLDKLNPPDPVTKVVIAEIRFRVTRAPEDDLRRRLALMSAARSSSGGNLISLLEDTVATAPKAAALVAKFCSRSLVEKLFLTVGTVREAIELRVKIVDWLVAHGQEENTSLSEERVALLRELDNLDTRTDLDSTRVHVDEDALRQWFRETQSDKVSRYIQTVIAEGPVTEHKSVLPSIAAAANNASEDDIGIDIQIGSDVLMVSIVDSVMAAFARDRNFGLDAFLSRRIRHGTLSGQLVTPVARALEPLRSAPDRSPLMPLKAGIEAWMQSFVSEIDRTRSEIIQIRSPEKPEGLIQASWRTPTNAVFMDAMIAKSHARVLAAGGKYDVFQDIYNLCWDCLEADLARLRYYMARQFAAGALEELDKLFNSLDATGKRLGFQFLAEAHSKLSARVQEICGWFIRPVFRQDSYNLSGLLQSTFSIVRELDVNHNFKEIVDIDGEINLDRGGFEIIGDLLFIFIGNAAKHGTKGGVISVRVQPDELPGLIVITVTNGVDPQKFEEAMLRITEATSADMRAKERAAVGEGFSGLRKAALMVQSLPARCWVHVVSDADQSEVGFELKIPPNVAFRRAR